MKKVHSHSGQLSIETCNLVVRTGLDSDNVMSSSAALLTHWHCSFFPVLTESFLPYEFPWFCPQISSFLNSCAVLSTTQRLKSFFEIVLGGILSYVEQFFLFLRKCLSTVLLLGPGTDQYTDFSLNRFCRTYDLKISFNIHKCTQRGLRCHVFHHVCFFPKSSSSTDFLSFSTSTDI